MRLTLISVAFYAALAILAGCSSLSPSAVPPASSGGASMNAPGSLASRAGYQARLLEELKLQIEGTLPHALPVSVLKHEYEALSKAPQHLRKTYGTASGVTIWALNDWNYLVGLNNEAKTLISVNLMTFGGSGGDGCNGPQTVKVDGSQNVWIACNDVYGEPSGGAYAEYAGAGTFENDYRWDPRQGCPPSAVSCSGRGYATDGAADATNVFSLAGYNRYQYCTDFEYPYCYSWYSNNSQGVYFWPAGNPSAAPTYVPLWVSDSNGVNTQCSPVCSIDYMDLDASGNIWFDGSVCATLYGVSTCGSGLGEIKNPSQPSRTIEIAQILPPSEVCATGGVYVGTRGGTQYLDVTNPCTRRVLQYSLPISQHSKPKLIGPTPKNRSNNCGQPISGGVGSSGAMVQGDACGWVDFKTGGKPFRALTSPDLELWVPSAAITPSDKST